MKQMLKLGIVLALFASVACVMLALVNNLTSSIIAENKAKEVTQGLTVVFADADSFEPAPNFTPDTATTVKVESLYLAKKGTDVVGAVAQATGPTYDTATILLGMDLNRTLTGLRFLSITDTPGFGQKATEPEFYNQFTGKSANDDFAAGSDIQAISGATITTKGVAQLAKYTAYVAGEYLAQNYGGAAGSGSAPVIQGPATVFTYEEACKSLFPHETYPYAEFVEVDKDLYRIVRNMIVEKQYLVVVDGKTVGAMAAVRGQTYKEGGVVLTAVDMNRNIIGARIIELNDTPNMGQLTLEEDFYSQFAGKPVDGTLSVNGDIDAITGATISSACIADIVKVGAMEAAWVASSRGGTPAPEGSENYPLNEMYLEE